MNNDIRNALIAAGVKNLREFGYPTCTAENILTVRVFARFFDGMLEDHPQRAHAQEVAALRAEIKNL